MQENIYDEEWKARETICEIGRRMYQRGFVAANDGNISIRIGDNQLVCTPSGVSKGFMREEDLVITDMCGNILSDGVGQPSSELKMHLKIYEKDQYARAVVHAHPKTATAFAVAGISLEEPILVESVVVLGPVPLAPYATAGTEEVAAAVEPYCEEYHGLLLANHGALSWAETPMQAWYYMEEIEHTAEILLRSKYLLGKANVLDEKQVDKLRVRYKSMDRKGKNM